MTEPVSAARARRTLLVLTFTRWFPVGLMIGLTTLLVLQRGLGLSEVGLVAAVQGFVVLALELPTGGVADAIGRRPVLVVAAAVGIGSSVLFVTAHTLAAFVFAAALTGLYRALDSGPLEAWYVDAAHAEDPASPVERTLALAGTVLGAAIAGGALVSGVLVTWHPVSSASPLLLPFWVAIGLNLAHLVGTAVWVREPRRGTGRGGRRVVASVRTAPGVVRDGLRTLAVAPVLRCLVLVEVFWSVAMIAFETLNTARLAELVGGEDRAGAIIGPVSSAAWGLFAAGAVLAGLASRWIGVGWTALAARVLNGAFVIMMGLAAGPAGLVAAFWASYAMHGAAGPMHSALLHRQASPANRTTVLSMNSMVAGGSLSVGLLILGPLAEHTSTATAIVVAGAFSTIGALLYLPAIRVAASESVASAPPS